MLAGESLLVPISEVGSLASALGWMASCAAYLRMKPSSIGRVAATTGLIVTSMMILMKLLPTVPGHFSSYEWVALLTLDRAGTCCFAGGPNPAKQAVIRERV